MGRGGPSLCLEAKPRFLTVRSQDFSHVAHLPAPSPPANAGNSGLNWRAAAKSATNNWHSRVLMLPNHALPITLGQAEMLPQPSQAAPGWPLCGMSGSRGDIRSSVPVDLNELIAWRLPYPAPSWSSFLSCDCPSPLPLPLHEHKAAAAGNSQQRLLLEVPCFEGPTGVEKFHWKCH